jgi:hypothetical protein
MAVLAEEDDEGTHMLQLIIQPRDGLPYPLYPVYAITRPIANATQP